jgi:D-alanine-D-alanine ligase
MRVTNLTYVEQEGSREYDPVVTQVAEALRQLGHQPAGHADLGKLRSGPKRRRPELIFNLMETFGSDQLGAVSEIGLGLVDSWNAMTRPPRFTHGLPQRPCR